MKQVQKHFSTKFSRAQQVGILRGLMTVALADDEVSDLERKYLQSFGDFVLQCEFELEALEPISPTELALLFPRIEDKEWVLGYCILIAFVDGKTSPPGAEVLKNFREAFKIHSLEYETFLDIQAQNSRRLMHALKKWSYSGHAKRQNIKNHPLDFIRNKIYFRLRLENKFLVEEYRALSRYNEGSLGKSFFEFVQFNELGFPGNPESLSEYIIFHDLSHVLGGFGISPEEEVLLAGFMAGYQSYNPFFTIFAAICLFHLGIPTLGSDKARVQSMKWQPDAFFREMLRGSKCKIDLSDGWDHWPYMEKPLEQVRNELNIEPRFF